MLAFIGLILPVAVGRVEWRALPHVGRAQIIRTACASVALGVTPPLALANSAALTEVRSVHAIREWGAIPVWPVWPTPASPTGGRVRPISLAQVGADPFLLLAHHRHSFSPGDPLRGPFRAVGGALGLPYVGEEGFKLHPHRGIDIWTYVLDGSDGFKHKDSLGGECVYRGGSCQFMRSGKGAMHEEMWETRSDRSTKVELFQIWVNLPRRLKMAPPAIRYLGDEWGAPFAEEYLVDAQGRSVVKVRTLDLPSLTRANDGDGAALETRPPVSIRHATLEPGAFWVAKTDSTHSAIAYVRSGVVHVNNQVLGELPTGATCTFNGDGESAWFVNRGKEPADVLLLTGEPLKEPVVMGGPIVMNTQEEIDEAFAELRQGTFL